MISSVYYRATTQSTPSASTSGSSRVSAVHSAKLRCARAPLAPRPRVLGNLTPGPDRFRCQLLLCLDGHSRWTSPDGEACYGYCLR